MNENHSKRPLRYKERWVTPLLASAAKEHPVVVLTGARQTGKSTLLTHGDPFSSWEYLTFDDFNLISQAQSEPSSLWTAAERIVLDEVQKVPRLLSAIKQSVDRQRFGKRFILSGSANLLLMSKVSESLAGRAVYFPLLPMTLGEIKGRPAADTISRIFKGGLPKPRAIAADKSKDPYPFMAKGFMPALMAVNKGEECARWWEGYVTTYLERDLRQMSQIDSLPDFRRFMEAVALRSGQLLNQTDIARDVGVSQATVYRYINLLDTTCLLRRVPAYAKNRTKRLIKSSKAYLIDPALTAFLCGHFEEEALKTAKEAGSIFECMVLLHLEALCELMTPKARIFYWRTVSGREVDFVVEYGKKLIAVEAKLSRSIDYKQTQGLRAFMEDYPETVAGMIAYTGNEIRYLGEKILAVPWTVFAGLS